MILKQFSDISTGFRLSEISVECPVHICSLFLNNLRDVWFSQDPCSSWHLAQIEIYCTSWAFFKLYFGNLKIYIYQAGIFMYMFSFHSCYIIFICRQAKMDKVGIRMDFIFEVGRLRVSFTKGPFKSRMSKSIQWLRNDSWNPTIFYTMPR